MSQLLIIPHNSLLLDTDVKVFQTTKQFSLVTSNYGDMAECYVGNHVTITRGLLSMLPIHSKYLLSMIYCTIMYTVQ